MTGKDYRITVLTDRLIRLEYNTEGRFEDRPTRAVVCRDFPGVCYSETREESGIIIETDKLRLTYDEKSFSTTGLTIRLKDTDIVWHYSVVHGNTDQNLFGTARTLDESNGYVKLDPGIFGRYGYAVMDDSQSPVMVSDSGFKNHENEGMDMYFFGYGRDYYGGLRDFAILCGRTPMLPRYALGNWWSRYYRYCEESYMELLDSFADEEIPLSVAVLDMDWHLTEVDEKYGTGWTGYSWNRDLFPDPDRFLKSLHDKKLAVTLNLHPADGIRAFEDMYEEAARCMGIDPGTQKPVEFDLSDESFRKVYFENVLHPIEESGVDFWWIDWQQGTGSGKDDVDPLFLLNHYHYHDMEGRNIRPMIFSRYAGVGSHRYPVGFSGDTAMSWSSLAYQPYFTSTASNIGYGWWSHDIGGHMMGDKDMERLIRWIQFGTFSPIMRLHSSNSRFLNKEPWTMEEPFRSITGEFMRLRHRLLPYLYTENYRAYTESKPLIRPMYYDNPDDEDAYRVPNEYGFGESLMVAAITEKTDEQLRLAPVNVLIPNGRYYDIFNGGIYDGRIKGNLYRKLDEIPVLLKAGGIVPLSCNDRGNGTDNPCDLEVLVGSCADGEYTMYEDDGVSMEYLEGRSVSTGFELSFTETENGCIQRFKISPARGDLSLVPDMRRYTVTFFGIRPVEDNEITCTRISGEGEGTLEYRACVTKYNESKNTVTIVIDNHHAASSVCVELSGFGPARNDPAGRIFEILDNAWIDNLIKDSVYDALMRMNEDDFKEWLKGEKVPEILKDAIFEII